MIFSNFIPSSTPSAARLAVTTTASQPSSGSELSDSEELVPTAGSATVCRLRRLMRASSGRSVGKPAGGRWAARAAVAAGAKQQADAKQEQQAPVADDKPEDRAPVDSGRQWQLGRKYTMSEVQQHSQLDDCWMVIFDKVYNISEFVNEHPGGDFILLEYAGRDATHPFLSSRHGSSAYKMLDKYWIGILVDEELYYSNNSSYCSVYSNLSWRSTPTMKDSSSTDSESSDSATSVRLSPPLMAGGQSETGNSAKRTSSTPEHHRRAQEQQQQQQQQRSQRHECNTCNSSSAGQARSETG